MRTLRFLLEKEFHQLFRNRAMLRILLLTPLIQLLVLPFAANFEIRNINIAVVDHDHSGFSQRLVTKILASGYFSPAGSVTNYNDAYTLIAKDKADIIMEIPAGFERNLIREQGQKLFLAINAINGVKALVGSGYLNSIINAYNSEILVNWKEPSNFNPSPNIDIDSYYWYNPHLVYTIFMVPGILVMLVTLFAGNMSAFNIVKEKEMGTIEQINVTPIKKPVFILGKLIPFWLLAMFEFSFGLLIARFVYGIIPLGSLWTLYFFLSVYLVAFLGFGLLISTYAETQQQAHSLTFFFVTIFNMMSGLFTPIDSMPAWAQMITNFIPMSYFIEVMRMVVLKGSTLYDIRYHFAIIALMAVVLNTWAILNYRKRA
ncbi:MAG: ABC transporter permease [Bacteroidia bacterium]